MTRQHAHRDDGWPWVTTLQFIAEAIVMALMIGALYALVVLSIAMGPE